MDVLADPPLLRLFAAINIIFLFTITGGALAMYLIVMPVIQCAHAFPTAVLLHHFNQLIAFGIRYMQTSARTQSGMLAALALTTYISDDDETHQGWTWFAAALGTLVQAAWYEIVFVFPTNDRLIDMKGQLKRVGNDAEADQNMKAEALHLLEKWRQRHIPRIILPFAAGVLVIKGTLF